MEDALFETEYDVVIVGTGIVESIVAGALARAGQKVLHLDTNDYYGSNFASLNFDQFNVWMDAPIDDDAPFASTFRCTRLHDARADGFAPRSNAFSLDIQPKVLLSSSPLVDVLVHSGVGRYLDFMAMHETCMFTPQPPHPPVWPVPCSKTDVFKSRLSVLEKRHLMKFLQFVADYGNSEGDDDATTLNERDLAVGRALKRPQNKRDQKNALGALDSATDFNVVLHAVLLLTTAPTAPLSPTQSLDRLYGFLSSIGRFAPSPFLTPLYGISEVAQAFCRLSAVYGGIYYLRAPLNGIVTTPETVATALTTSTREKKTWKGRHFVLNAMYASSYGVTPHSTTKLLRGIFLLPGTRPRTVLIVPPKTVLQHPFAMHIISLDGTTAVCPAEHTLVHVSTIVDAMPNEAMVHLLQHVLASSFPDAPPVWETVFTLPVYAAPPPPPSSSSEASAQTTTSPRNVHVCGVQTSPMALESVLESAVDEAKAIFEAICPGAEFLPKSASAEQAEMEAATENDETAQLLQAATNLLHMNDDDDKVVASTPEVVGNPAPTTSYDL
ncbi:hypothetical protein SPRG_09687 [Saprolegnia parasitica CBS 223.65]|uniref:Rab proteins geranylgeranyltransferase component n=1 Tax=Saprolegnia parasitica (strain CBS 223.65) TaxID=695850 RepID=A0A067C6R3_SAPPC|nr:hypothetical protein SPRG_09687 [Saprolegnia parasitica CBS 223.65]KDO24855.1 hypothetical protein SPRG_09687 [Saprolegnia parasitica CBS 223.65]|eukprot:XP_012204501.1 hypothetical protein SPRG_09687 [Saprolegnia parasitica CBS 223.65]